MQDFKNSLFKNNPVNRSFMFLGFTSKRLYTPESRGPSAAPLTDWPALCPAGTAIRPGRNTAAQRGRAAPPAPRGL